MQFTRARNKVKSLIRSAKRLYEKQIVKKSKLNPKPFWAYTKRKLKTTSGVNPLLENVNDPASLKFQAFDKANILQKQFTSVFTVEPPGDLPTVKSKTNVNLQNLELTVESVKKQQFTSW